MPSSSLFAGTAGPHDARVVVVGEAYGEQEDYAKLPFIGPSGRLLRGQGDRSLPPPQWLEENAGSLIEGAGFDSRDWFFTNVVSARPANNQMWTFVEPTKEATNPAVRSLFPDETLRRGLDTLYEQIDVIRPDLIIAAGNWALWALTEHSSHTGAKDPRGRAVKPPRRVPTGIGSWRGSMTYANAVPGHAMRKLLPIAHPAAIMRQWPLFNLTRFDLRTRVPLALNDDWRPKRMPTMLAPPTFPQAKEYFLSLLLRLERGPIVLSVDIETAKKSFITCIGFASTTDFAISIPFVQPRTYAPFYPLEEETTLRDLIRRVLAHSNTRLLGQNFLYDIQFLEFELLARELMPFWDTMAAQHVFLPGTPKDLGHLASLYSYHYWYWKNDSQEWDEKEDLPSLLRYNCWDVIRPLEIYEQQRDIIPARGLDEQWAYMLETYELALTMMRRGILVDKKERAKKLQELFLHAESIRSWFQQNLPQSLVNPDKTHLVPWWNSPIQMREVFTSMGIRLPLDRKTGQPSTGKEAMPVLRSRYPGLTPLWDRIQALRGLDDAIDTISMKTESDGRVHTSFGPAGPETFRWNSFTNPFGRGGNMQNLPKLQKKYGAVQDAIEE